MTPPAPLSPASSDDVDVGLDPSRPRPRPRPVERWRQWIGDLDLTPGRVVGAALGAVALAVVGVWLLRAPSPAIEDQLPMAPGVEGTDPGSTTNRAGAGSTTSSTAAGPEPTEPTELVVHAAGAVTRPGLYRLAPSARTADLVEAAGGLTADADADRLNLAAPLTDGARIWVPERGEAEPPDAVNGGPVGEQPGSPPGTGPASEPVDLNTATLAELDTLPGVGPATAQAIVDHRTTNGPYRAVDELLDVRGIGDAKLADLRDRVRV